MLPTPRPELPPPAEAVEAKLFRSLGHPIRLRVLRFLEAGELTVGDLQERLGIAQSHLSNHLACLRNCGLVETRAEGRRVYYRLADERVREVLALAGEIARPRAGEILSCRHIR